MQAERGSNTFFGGDFCINNPLPIFKFALFGSDVTVQEVMLAAFLAQVVTSYYKLLQLILTHTIVMSQHKPHQNTNTPLFKFLLFLF